MKSILLFAVVFFSCHTKKIVEIETGLPLPTGVIKIDPTATGLLISSASFGDAIEVKHNEALYNVVLNKKNQVTYVSTIDSNFKTSDGIRIGQTYKEIKDKLNTEWPEPGFAYCGQAKSSWTVAFFDDLFLKTRNVSDTSRVQFFYKRIN